MWRGLSSVARDASGECTTPSGCSSAHYPPKPLHLLALLDCARSFGIVTIRGSVVDDFHKSAADRVHVSLLWECSPCAGLTRIVVHGSHLGCY